MYPTTALVRKLRQTRAGLPMTKTSLMMSERAAASSGSSVFSACVAVLMHGRRSSFCQAAIMPKVAPSSRVIIASLLLPLFKDTLSLLLRTSIKLGGKIKGIWVESGSPPGGLQGTLVLNYTLVLYFTKGLQVSCIRPHPHRSLLKFSLSYITCRKSKHGRNGGTRRSVRGLAYKQLVSQRFFFARSSSSLV